MKYKDWTFENIAAWLSAVVIFSATMAVFMGGILVARGYVLSVIWGWFVVPIFHLAPLSWSNAVAVCFVAGFFHDLNPAIKKGGTTESAAEGTARGADWIQLMNHLVYVPVLTLISGYIIKAVFM
jgi:hypothetical protein